MLHPPIRHALLLFAALLASGCASSESGGAGSVPPDEPPTEGGLDSPIVPPKLRVLRLRAWPGGGIQLTLARQDELGFALQDPDGNPIEATVTRTLEPSPGLTALALRANATTDDLALAEALVQALPPDERIAIWRLEALATPLADFTRERAHLLTVISAFEPSTELSTELAVTVIRDALAAVDGVWGPIARDLVLVGKTPDAGSMNGAVQPVGIHRLVSTSDPAKSAADFTTGLLAQRSGNLRIGWCPNTADGKTFTLSHADAAYTLPIPNGVSGMSGVDCDATDAAEDAYPFGSTIDLEFSASQRALHDARHAANSPLEFEGSVRVGPSDPIEATLHFRGHTSLECERKSLHVNLKGDPHRRTLPGTASDRFLLISMCKDDRYHQQAFGDRLMRDLGMFPLSFRFVRLSIDGVNAGVYFQLDEPDSTIERQNAALTAIIRRRFDPEDEAEDVKMPDDPVGIADALDRYHAFTNLPQTKSGLELKELLETSMALDHYLQWLAFNSLVKNGDFVDEVFFHASSAGDDAWHFRMMGWDPDDLVAACHHSGKHAISDPYGLLFCAEADLDQALVASPEIYARFVTHVEILATEVLTDAVFEETMEEVREELFAVLDTNETVGAMTELLRSNPNATTVEAARSDIEEHMQGLLVELTARRELLLERVEDYWSEGDTP